MSEKVSIREANKGELWTILVAKPDGSINEEPIHAVERLSHDAMVKAMIQEVKSDDTMRNMRQTLLFEIFKNVKLKGYRGKSDAKTGKTDPAFRDALRACETEYFEVLAEKGELKTVLKDTEDKTLRDFITKKVSESNYKNIKSTVAKYFAFCGKDCATPSGFLVPYKVMRESINAMLVITPPDNSIAGQLERVHSHMAKLEDWKASDINKAYPIAKEILSIIQSQVNRLAELATNANAGLPPTGAPLQAGDVVQAAEETISKMRRAPAPVKAKAIAA